MRCDIISPLDVKIGRSYYVPCVRDRYDVWMPIVGPSHVDGAELCQFSSIPEHYHLDKRFIRAHEKQVGYRGIGGIRYRLLECIDERSDNGVALWAMIRLGRAFQNFRINTDRPICLHNRQNIVNKDGQCPGHGFCWDLETGRPKYRWPYFVRYKGTDYKYPAEDREIISLEYPKTAERPLFDVVVELIDSDDKVIGEQRFNQYISSGDILKLVTNCSEATKTPFDRSF